MRTNLTIASIVLLSVVVLTAPTWLSPQSSTEAVTTHQSVTGHVSGALGLDMADEPETRAAASVRSIVPEPPRQPTQYSPLIVQQRTGTVCDIGTGTCRVRSQPIGSPCRCSTAQDAPIGRITR